MSQNRICFDNTGSDECWSSFLAFNDGGEEMHIHVFIAVCNGEISVSFHVHESVFDLMTQFFSPCVFVSVCLHLCLCFCVHASKSLAEREYPSDRRALPRHIGLSKHSSILGKVLRI